MILLIESVTGEDMITGEDLSEFEKGMKLASGVVSRFTLGQGGVIINGGRVAFQSTLVTMGKMVAINMVTTGVTYGTSKLCQKMGMPGSVTMLLSMLAGGKAGSTLNNKWLENLSAEDVKRYQLWNELRENGLDQNVVDDIILTNKGFRPDSKSYLGNQYIIEHLQKFNDGASIIMTKEQYFLYVKGNDYIGIPNDGRNLYCLKICVTN